LVYIVSTLKGNDRISKKEKIRKDEISDVQGMYYTEPQEDMLGVINSFTRYGKVVEEDNGTMKEE